MNKVLAKCTADEGQLGDRKRKGAEYIELHLRDTEPSSEKYVYEMINRVTKEGLKAIVVHAPMGREYILEAFGCERADNRMRLVALLAQKLYECHGEEVIVVVHQELYMSQLESFGLLRKAEPIIRELLTKYPGVKIAFENLSIMNIENGRLVVRGSYRESPVEIAEYFRAKIGTDRIGTVLDTCHALNAIRIEEIMDKRVWSIIEYIKNYSGTMFLIHLSNAVGVGFEESHGQSFDSRDDKYLLSMILSEIERVRFRGPITLELVEKENENAVMFSRMYSELTDRRERKIV